MTNQSQPRKRGCFFSGCLALIVVVLVVAVGLVLTFRFAKGKIDRAVTEYTEAQPAQIEKGDASPAKLNAIQKRIDAFRDGVAAGQPQELSLTADEINTLLAGQADLQDLANKLYVIIDGDQMKAKISWPLTDIGPLKLQGRYLNGTAKIAVSLRNGQPDLRIEDFESRDAKTLPPMILDELRKHNFADDLQRDAQTASALRMIDSVEVKDGKVIVRHH
jgi:hypothetical protein